uniref:F-box domain-containing protein n=1 Tax=Setaria italica TaxID=4555 RepID=K4AKG8_SETIT
MVARRPCWSLSDLPIEVFIDIVGHLAVTSDNPLEDLRRLRATCRLMLRACGDRAMRHSRATVSGLNVVAYLYALFLYRNNGSATDDDIARMYIRRMEGEGEDGAAAQVSTGSMKLGNLGCQEHREEVYNYVWCYTWRKRSDPLPPTPVRGDFPCIGGTCGKAKSWPQIRLFCSEGCRIRYEIAIFVSKI